MLLKHWPSLLIELLELRHHFSPYCILLPNQYPQRKTYKVPTIASLVKSSFISEARLAEARLFAANKSLDTLCSIRQSMDTCGPNEEGAVFTRLSETSGQDLEVLDPSRGCSERANFADTGDAAIERTFTQRQNKVKKRDAVVRENIKMLEKEIQSMEDTANGRRTNCLIHTVQTTMVPQ
ncbi:hypothetical protein C8R41DRAFT_904760 [Lentinula lateritia]|uniref:Uncharacterized protein n=1 Tax=Lentinula lateritia TaxID=40482 RepID=A0ABQ8V6P2_9AGAR|nr:hypothetical protein C8R41DRAFT_904760 [Lentinula lateritia]